MAQVTVQFRYLTGLKRRIFRNARLVGNWDQQGRESLTWSDAPMKEITADPEFRRMVALEFCRNQGTCVVTLFPFFPCTPFFPFFPFCGMAASTGILRKDVISSGVRNVGSK